MSRSRDFERCAPCAKWRLSGGQDNPISDGLPWIRAVAGVDRLMSRPPGGLCTSVPGSWPVLHRELTRRQGPASLETARRRYGIRERRTSATTWLVRKAGGRRIARGSLHQRGTAPAVPVPVFASRRDPSRIAPEADADRPAKASGTHSRGTGPVLCHCEAPGTTRPSRRV